MYEIISSGSHGNAVLYSGVLVDCGVSYKAIEPHLRRLKIILLSHAHQDHLNVKTLKKIICERPGVRVGCGLWMLEKLKGIDGKKIDVMEAGKNYVYSGFLTNIEIKPVQLYHDVPNFGYKLNINGYKIFHATDTAHLEGIEAKDYDLYAIEHNHDSEDIQQRIEEKRAAGKFAYEVGASNSHLSRQQAIDFIIKNGGDKYEVIKLHQTKH